MPVYQYVCKNCGSQYELLVETKDRDTQICLTPCFLPLTRVVQDSVLTKCKGPGFYSTDNRKLEV